MPAMPAFPDLRPIPLPEEYNEGSGASRVYRDGYEDGADGRRNRSGALPGGLVRSYNEGYAAGMASRA